MESEYLSAMLGAARELAARGEIRFPGATVPLTGGMMTGITLEEGADELLLPGSIISARCRLELANAEGEWLPGGSLLGSHALAGAEFTLEIGVSAGQTLYASCGCYTVSGATAAEGGGMITLTGEDRLARALEGTFEDSQAYPRTIEQTLAHILGQTGLDAAGTLACNGAVVIARRPVWGAGCSLRNALKHTLQARGSFLRLDRDGTAQILPARAADITLMLGPSHYTRLEYGARMFRLARVRVLPPGADDAPVLAYSPDAMPEDGSNTLVIRQNPLFRKGASTLQTMADSLLYTLYGMEYREAAITWRGSPEMRAGGRVRLTDTRGETVEMTALRATLTLSGGMSGTLSCPADVPQPVRMVGAKGGFGLRADGCITAGMIAPRSVTTDKLAAGAVDTDNLGEQAVTSDKLAAGSVTADNAALAAAAILTANIADAAITRAKIADAAIGNAQMDNAAIGSAQIALGAITQALIASGAIGTAQIADGSITDAKIVTLTANKINAGTMSVERLILVGSDQSLVYAINSANDTPQLSVSTLDGGALTQRSITADRLVAGAITAGEIAAETIMAGNIAAGAITGIRIAAGTIGAANISAGAITTSLIAAAAQSDLVLAANAALVIGGANLLPGTSDTVGTKTTATYATLYPGVAIAALGVVPGEALMMQVWLNPTGTDAFRMRIMQYNAGGSYISGTTSYGNPIAPGATGVSGAAVTIHADCATFIIQLDNVPRTGSNACNWKRAKMERGNKLTDWCLHAGELINNNIKITNAGIEILSGGALDIAGGTGVKTIGMSNARADELFLYAGSATPASAPFRVKMDGSVYAGNISRDFAQHFQENADASYPAAFDIYIPTGTGSVSSVLFSFKAAKYRADSKSAGTPSATYTGTPDVSSTGGASPSYSAAHTHSLNAHKHTLSSHTHSLSYGIYEKSSLPASCTLKVDGNTVGTYTNTPPSAQDVDIKSYLAATGGVVNTGWHTITVETDDDARIVAHAYVRTLAV